MAKQKNTDGEPKAGRRISTAGKADPVETKPATDEAPAKPLEASANAAAAGLRRVRAPKQRRLVEGAYRVLSGIRYQPRSGGGVTEVHAPADLENDPPVIVTDLSPEDVEHFLAHECIEEHFEEG